MACPGTCDTRAEQNTKLARQQFNVGGNKVKHIGDARVLRRTNAGDHYTGNIIFDGRQTHALNESGNPADTRQREQQLAILLTDR